MVFQKNMLLNMNQESKAAAYLWVFIRAMKMMQHISIMNLTRTEATFTLLVLEQAQSAEH